MNVAAIRLKTSENDPFRIGELPLGKGVIGMSICPGSHDYEGRSGPRERSLEADLQVIRAGGYGIVVTLLETWELDFLHVAGMGETVAAHGMSWWHLPVKDCCPLEYPGDGFMDARIDRWSLPCALLLRFLHAGGRVFIHCRGGLGRTGSLAAFLLVLDGLDAEESMKAVRSISPGAIEYLCQEDWLRHLESRYTDPLLPYIPQSEFDSAVIWLLDHPLLHYGPVRKKFRFDSRVCR
jgi:protein-tyrosine phosphatase